MPVFARGKSFFSFVSFFLLFCFFFIPSQGAEVPRNPNSAKECAICHYRWIDTFFIDGKGSDLVDYQALPVVAEVEICFSCHDGSVVDSRSRVFNDRRHKIDKPPPSNMKIPKIFPLDQNGNMQCATCHTAHGVSSEMGIEKTIFLRVSNENSAMCIMCHSDKAGGPAVGNHPINTTALEIPKELLDLGAEIGEKKNQLICETCHTVHGSSNKNFLVSTARDSDLCMICHKEQALVKGTDHDLRVTAEHTKNRQNKTTAEAGLCGACHLVHGGGKQNLWARFDPGSKGKGGQGYCLGCHSEDGVAKKKMAEKHSHPMDLSPSKKGLSTSLPLYDLEGRKSKNGVISCQTCHDPHRWDSNGKMGIAENLEGDSRNSFLRLENSPSPKLCGDCHTEQVVVAKTDHDLIVAGPESKNILGQRPVESGVCGVCHLVHGGGKDFLWARESGRGKNRFSKDFCQTCHVSHGPAKKKILKGNSHPVDIVLSQKGLTTSLPLYDREGKRDKSGMMTCQTCHDPHRWDSKGSKVNGENLEGDSRNSFLRFENSPNPKLCGDCHEEQALVVGTDHDMQVTAPASKNFLNQKPVESGPCGACHGVHNGIKPLLWLRGFAKGAGVLDGMCNDCHSLQGCAKDKIPQTALHPKDKLVTNVGRNKKGMPDYFPLFDKKTGEAVTVGDIACASCHNVHQWNPRIHAPGPGINQEGMAINSFLRPQTFDMVCKDCHGFDALYRFKYYHDSRKRGGRAR